MSLLEEACEWAASLRLADIPPDVQELALAMLMSQRAAAHATTRHPVGNHLRGLAGTDGWPAAAAGVALLTMALDWDESTFAGHVGHSAALPLLACAAALGADGREALTAIVAAAEIGARVTAAVTLGRARGQAAGHTHLAAAATGFGLLHHLPPRRLAEAVGLALAQPSRVLLPAFMGSDAKFWVAAAPVLTAARAVTIVAAGGRGAAGVLEGPGGLLAEAAELPLPEAFGGWGQRWHLRTLAVKRFPGCAYLSAAVEAAAELAPLDLAEVRGVELHCSIFTLRMEAESAPFVSGPDSPLPALTFSVGYSLAAALEAGTLDAADFAPPRLTSPERWGVAERLRLHHDPDLTVAALAATAPIGAALAWAGERAQPYLEAAGAPGELAQRALMAARANLDDPFFEHPSKRIGVRLRVELRDGRRLEAARAAADGSPQEIAPARLGLAETKLRAQAPDGGDSDVEAIRRLPELPANALGTLVVSLPTRPS